MSRWKSRSCTALAAIAVVIGAAALYAPQERGSGSAGVSLTSNPAPSSPSVLSSTDIAIATRVAISEAYSAPPRQVAGGASSAAASNPTSYTESTSGSPQVEPTRWPTYVDTVSAMATSHGDAEQYVGSGPVGAGSQAVLVIRLTGDFAVMGSAPPRPTDAPLPSSEMGGYVQGTIMTIVVDARSGALLDFGLEGSADNTPVLTRSTVLYSR